MSDFDHDRVSALLNIVAQCAGHSGKLGALSNAAMAELLEGNKHLHEKAVAKKKQVEEADAKMKADQVEVEEENEEEEQDGTIKPSVFPRDSNTATIADNNVPRRV